MATLEEMVDNLELPLPVVVDGHGEDLNSYARRIAYIGALAGKQHGLTHAPPAVVKIPVLTGAPLESTPVDDEPTTDE